MNKKPISIKGSYRAPECEVTNIGTSKIFCTSITSSQLEDATVDAWGEL